MAISMPVTARAWTHRRSRFSTASATPSAAAASPSSRSSSRLPWVIAPSMMDLVSSGMTISAPTDAQAAASMKMRRPR
jgi:hypothetical protein